MRAAGPRGPPPPPSRPPALPPTTTAAALDVRRQMPGLTQRHAVAQRRTQLQCVARSGAQQHATARGCAERRAASAAASPTASTASPPPQRDAIRLLHPARPDPSVQTRRWRACVRARVPGAGGEAGAERGGGPRGASAARLPMCAATNGPPAPSSDPPKSVFMSLSHAITASHTHTSARSLTPRPLAPHPPPPLASVRAVSRDGCAGSAHTRSPARTRGHPHASTRAHTQQQHNSFIEFINKGTNTHANPHTGMQANPRPRLPPPFPFRSRTTIVRTNTHTHRRNENSRVRNARTHTLTHLLHTASESVILLEDRLDAANRPRPVPATAT